MNLNVLVSVPYMTAQRVFALCSRYSGSVTQISWHISHDFYHYHPDKHYDNSLLPVTSWLIPSTPSPLHYLILNLCSMLYSLMNQQFVKQTTTLWKLIPCSWVLPEKLKRPKLLKKFLAFYGTRRFITVLTAARRLSLPWARSIQSMPPIQPLDDPF